MAMSCWHAAGAQRWCFKGLRHEWMEMEIDGVATSDSLIVLVEKKQRITADYVFEFESKVNRFK